MNQRRIKLLHKDAKIPFKAYPLDAGYDCYSVQDIVLEPYSYCRIPLGFSVEVKAGQMLTIRSRSSTKMKGVSCFDTTCDAGYTGELYGFLVNHSKETVYFSKGDRIVQIVFHKLAQPNSFIEGDLPDSIRNTKGFGSSGS